MRLLKEWTQTALVLISCTCAILALGAVEADNFALVAILMIILLVNTYILMKYGRGEK